MAEKNRLSCGGLSVNEVQGDWSVNDKNNPAYVKNRPFYESEKLIVSDDDWGYVFVKVAGADIANKIYENDDILKVYTTHIPVDGEIMTSPGMLPHIEPIGNDNRLIGLYLSVNDLFAIHAMITFEDNVDFYGLTFPETGVYFSYIRDIIEGTDYVSGLGYESTDTPDIVTWDGNFSDIKKIDEKFLPNLPNQDVVFKISELENTATCNVSYDELIAQWKENGYIMPIFVRGGNYYYYLISTNYNIDATPNYMQFNIQSLGDIHLYKVTYYSDGKIEFVDNSAPS